MLTDHASTRMQQRAIPPLIIDLLLLYGVEEHDGRGAIRRYFDKRTRRQLEHHLGRQIVRRIDDLLDAYLVEAGGDIVTVGWRR